MHLEAEDTTLAAPNLVDEEQKEDDDGFANKTHFLLEESEDKFQKDLHRERGIDHGDFLVGFINFCCYENGGFY